MISLNKVQQKRNKREFAGFPANSSHKKETGNMIAGEKEYETQYETQYGKGYENTYANGREDLGRAEGERAKKRGRFEFMQYIHGFIACLLVLLAVIHIPFPEPLAWLPYSVAAVLALITLKSEISIPVSRVLAIATTGMMFFFFALFFLVVPTLEAGWYTTQYGWAAVCLLLSAFVMIPILSDYSCRLKADCREARAARRTAFFSVPSHINPESR
jgi:Na+/H+ antiporter NhaD/arsenite permease-like protein